MQAFYFIIGCRLLLPVVGLEPTTLAGRDFESRAYANSATPAFLKHYNNNAKIPLASMSLCDIINTNK